MKDDYSDIISLPHHVSAAHPQMPVSSRAAQFAPFAALTGHAAAIAEAARLTEERGPQGEYEKEELNRKLLLLAGRISLRPEAEITYFVPDPHKAGGSCRTVCERIKKLDANGGLLFLEDNTAVPFGDIISLEIKFRQPKAD